MILDTGPLLAYLDRSEQNADWIRRQLELHRGEVWTCEAVLSEAIFLLFRNGLDHEPLFELLRRRAIQIPFQFAEHQDELWDMMTRYADLPMSPADACLVRMAELHPRAEIITLDRHFKLYRTRDRRVLKLRLPPERKAP